MGKGKEEKRGTNTFKVKGEKEGEISTPENETELNGKRKQE